MSGADSGSDGGRNAARGFQYQYLRTLEALLERIDDDSVSGVQVEGDTETGQCDKIDFAIMGLHNECLVSAQAKSKKPGGSVSASEAFAHLVDLITDSPARHYELLINALPGKNGRELTRVLAGSRDARTLRAALAQVLVGSANQLAALAALDADMMERLARARVEFDVRDSAAIRAHLREALRTYRNTVRVGLGHRSAGLLTGYLTDQVFLRAADGASARFTRAELRELLLIDDGALATAVGHRDWGVVVGAMPAIPDIARPDIFSQLTSHLADTTERRIREVALVGLSGIGKSSLAAAFVADRADAYDVLIWIDAQSPATLRASFQRALVALCPFETLVDADDVRLQAQAVTYLSSHPGRWALIFDNVEDGRDLSGWVPRIAAGDILYTAINSAVRLGNGVTIEVPAMTPDQAVQMLAARFSGTADDVDRHRGHLAAMSAALGHWPLALELGTAYMNSCTMRLSDIPDYLASLKMRSLQDDMVVPAAYPRNLIAAVMMCIGQLHPNSGDPSTAATRHDAWVILAASAYLAPRQIPLHLVATAAFLESDQLAAQTALSNRLQLFAADPESFNLWPTVRELRRFSLVSTDVDLPETIANRIESFARTIAINSVVQEVVRSVADQDGESYRGLLDRLAFQTERWLTSASDLTELDRAYAIFAHAETLARHLTARGVFSDNIWVLLGNVATTYRRSGDTAAAELLWREEIEYLSGQPEVNEFMIAQARLAIAEVGLSARPVDQVREGELIDLVERVCAFTADVASDYPDAAVRLVSLCVELLRARTLELTDPRWASLQDTAEAVLRSLPETTFSSALTRIRHASDLLLQSDFNQALQVAKSIIDGDEIFGPMIELTAQRIVVLVHANRNEWSEVSTELVRYQTMLGTSPIHSAEAVELAKPLSACAISALMLSSGPPASWREPVNVLAALLSWITLRQSLSTAPMQARLVIRLAECVLALVDGQPAEAERMLRRVSPDLGSADLGSDEFGGIHVVATWVRLGILSRAPALLVA